MSSTFKFHSQLSETVPWQAQYTFPTQATRVNKYTVKLPPKNGAKFLPGNILRIEFPADNYLNTLNSVFQFDLQLTGETVDKANTRFQRGGAQNVIKRLRVLYGSMVIEDIQEYKTLVRLFTECGVQDDYMSSLGTILDGMYATSVVETDATAAQGVATIVANNADNVITDHRIVGVELCAAKRTYCLNLLSGLLTSKKLLPLKYMAAQLAIEITLADAADCLLKPDIGTGGAVAPSYEIDNVNYIAELSEFDSTYDMAFQMGLKSGVPIKFASWHYHNFTMSGNNTVAQIHERSRSIKAAFAVIRDGQNPGFRKDSDRFFYSLAETISDADGLVGSEGTGPITEFQWRVGGKYYPSQPVRCTNGGAEALVELLKSLNMLGDYTRASAITYKNWVRSKFVISCEFEHTDVMGGDTIAGINAEEQSDIALTIKSDAPAANKRLDVFMYYDTLLIIREMNTVDLVL